MAKTDVVNDATGEATLLRHARRAFARYRLRLSLVHSHHRRTVVAFAAIAFGALMLAWGPDIPGTEALFVAVIRNAGNTFGVPAALAPTGVGATPQPGGAIRVQWAEPGASSVSPLATSWAGAYLIYRSESPATPQANATPHATVLSAGLATGTFIDGGTVNGQSCTGAGCPVNNTRYFYWVRALSRQTGFPSPFISTTVSAASDAAAPHVVSVSPGNSSIATPLGTNIQVVFSEPVDFESAVQATCIAPTTSPTSCVAATGNLARWTKSSGVLLELKPTSKLEPNKAYGVSFAATGTFAVRDLAGNPMAATAATGATSFTTEIPAGTVGIRWRSPAVTAQEYMPSSGPVVALTFAEPMNPADTASSFQMFAGVGCDPARAVEVTPTWSSSLKSVTFTPSVALQVGMMASPTYDVHTYSIRFNEGSASTPARSAANNTAASIACANGTFVPSTSVLAFDLADVPVGAPINEPHVVAGEPLVLRSVSGPWRQGSYTTLSALFDEPFPTGVATPTFAITGDTWTGLTVPLPNGTENGRHLLGVQNNAVAANIGQDVRTAFKAVTVVEPTINVTTFDGADTSETVTRTLLSPKASSDGDTVRFRVQVTAPGRDGSGVRPVAGMSVKVRALVNPVGYAARLCIAATPPPCSGSATELTLTTDSQGVVRGFLTAPNAGAPFNTIVLLASAGTEWGSIVLTDPAPTPPADLRFIAGTGRFTWTPSPTRGVSGYRVHLIPVGSPSAADVVIDAGDQASVGIPNGATVPGQAYRVSVVAYDASGRVSSASTEIDYVAPASTPTPSPSPTSLVTATSSATFTATVTVGPATAVASPTSVHSPTATVTAPTATAGASTATTTTGSSGGQPIGGVPAATVTSATGTPANVTGPIGTPSPGTETTSPTLATFPPTSPTVLPASTATPAFTPPASPASPTTFAPTIVVTPVLTTVAPTAVAATQVSPTTAPPPTPVPAASVVAPASTAPPASTPNPVAATPAPSVPTPLPSARAPERDEVTSW